MDQNSASPFLMDNLDTVLGFAGSGPVLDLACGTGVNGLVLAAKGVEVHFWDRDSEKLAGVNSAADEQGLKVLTRVADFETGVKGILPQRFFRAVLVFRYLHRPIIAEIKDAVVPGGVVVYETFTVDQSTLGRPCNPDYLLKRGELAGWFRDWDNLKNYEGRLEDPERYMAGIIAQKPGRFPV